MVQMCYDAKSWDVLNETISMLAKRRSQLKQAVTGMVQEAMTYIDQVRSNPNLAPHARTVHAACSRRKSIVAFPPLVRWVDAKSSLG